MQRIYIYIYIYKCECKKIEKWCDFLPSIPRIPPQFVHISCLLLVPQKCLSYPILLAASDQKVQLLYFFLYSSFFALLSLFFLCSYMAASLSHQSKISLSKEEIKELILKFQLQIVGGK